MVASRTGCFDQQSDDGAMYRGKASGLLTPGVRRQRL